MECHGKKFFDFCFGINHEVNIADENEQKPAKTKEWNHKNWWFGSMLLLFQEVYDICFKHVSFQGCRFKTPQFSTGFQPEFRENQKSELLKSQCSSWLLKEWLQPRKTPYLKPEIHFKTMIFGIYVRFRGGGGVKQLLFFLMKICSIYLLCTCLLMDNIYIRWFTTGQIVLMTFIDVWWNFHLEFDAWSCWTFIILRLNVYVWAN